MRAWWMCAGHRQRRGVSEGPGRYLAVIVSRLVHTVML